MERTEPQPPNLVRVGEPASEEGKRPELGRRRRRRRRRRAYLSFRQPKTTRRVRSWRSAEAHMMQGSTVTYSVHSAMRAADRPAASIASIASSSA